MDTKELNQSRLDYWRQWAEWNQSRIALCVMVDSEAAGRSVSVLLGDRVLTPLEARLITSLLLNPTKSGPLLALASDIESLIEDHLGD